MRTSPVALDRDLSQIAFHRRVLEEAKDESNPLLERVKFLSILATIVDEFVVTRCADLAREPGDHLRDVEKEITDLLDNARLYLRDELVPALAHEGIHLVCYADLLPAERAEVDSYFSESVLPILMPLGFDAARPFPHIHNRAITLAVIVRSGEVNRLACVQMPGAVPALVPFHWQRDAALQQGFVWLPDVVVHKLPAVFPGTEIVQVHPFRIVRDENIDPDTNDGSALPAAVERGLRRRAFGNVLSLHVDKAMPPPLIDVLSKNLAVTREAVRTFRELTDLVSLSELSSLDRPDLRDRSLSPHRATTSRSGYGIFDRIQEGDILLHHPFDSFQTVIDFVEEAARDPNVMAISTTLYRAGCKSPIVAALLAARRAGKLVRAVIEPRARFDEENNLALGRVLEDAGAHVVYGISEMKVHAKVTLIIRREAGRLRRYVHLSSGNYNPSTASVYTDLGLFSCHDDICRDATDVFNIMTGYATPSAFRKILVAPFTLRNGITTLIEREMAWAREGESAHVILKMNGLADAELIQRFYEASQGGVRLDLIVRGICSLRPGVPGISANIRVVSIVGRFLEHSRIWYFRNGGNEEIYVGSADLMPRNLDERIEVMAPLENDALKRRVRDEILATYLADNVKARVLMADGRYARVRRHESDPVINSQECLQ